MGVPNRAGVAPDPDQLTTPAPRRARGRRGRSSQATRAMILEAALAEFSEHGYDAATTASIARRVGVTQPLVHYHFGSKEILWKTTVNELFDRLRAELDARRAELEGTGPAVRLTGICYAFVDFVMTNPELTRIVNNDGVSDGPRLEWLVAEHVRPLADQWQREVDEAKRAGVIRDIPAPFLSFIFIGAAQHFFHLAPLVGRLFGIDPHAPETAKAYANALVEVFLQGCGSSNERTS